jgi:hypothetical protein
MDRATGVVYTGIVLYVIALGPNPRRSDGEHEHQSYAYSDYPNLVVHRFAPFCSLKVSNSWVSSLDPAYRLGMPSQTVEALRCVRPDAKRRELENREGLSCRPSLNAEWLPLPCHRTLTAMLWLSFSYLPEQLTHPFMASGSCGTRLPKG